MGISIDECALDLDCQPTQRGELSIVDVHLLAVDLEDAPEQAFGGLNPEKAITDNYKADEVQKHVWQKVLQLDLVLVQEPTKKVGG